MGVYRVQLSEFVSEIDETQTFLAKMRTQFSCDPRCFLWGNVENRCLIGEFDIRNSAKCPPHWPRHSPRIFLILSRGWFLFRFSRSTRPYGHRGKAIMSARVRLMVRRSLGCRIGTSGTNMENFFKAVIGGKFFSDSDVIFFFHLLVLILGDRYIRRPSDD